MQPHENNVQEAPSAAGRFDPPKERFCDVVMEGGITSGIIYASAVAELAQHYRFRNIGGSSIGAFAGALSAAAEFRRRGGSAAGFELLDKLPDTLATTDDVGNTKLRNLFNPQSKTRRLFEIFLATLGHDHVPFRYLYAVGAALWEYRVLVFGAVAIAALLVIGPLALIWLARSSPESATSAYMVVTGAWTGALVMAAALAVLVALAIGVVWDIWSGLVPNGFGLCRGWARGNEDDVEDLSTFMCAAIQQAAGLDPRHALPLTFKDLWDAPGGPATVLGFVGSAPAMRSINLEVYATNLAHGRPYRFPLDNADDMGRLFFRPADLEDYFPEPIVKHLCAYARPYRPQTPADPPATEKTAEFLELPYEHLPIAVAARIALSFPLLVSAVPLWAIDFEQPHGQRSLARCWMSDGGLCSNFPIHLFDSFLPKWPTFGISLQTRGKHWSVQRPGNTWLPVKDYQGAGDTWHRIEGGRLKQLTRFLLGLWLATWRWNDMTMMRMPGVRDRVVRVFLDKDEGGVNIKMTGDEIRNLAATYGKPAAEEFVAKFVPKVGDNNSFGWREHRWVRFNRLLVALRQQIEGFRFAAELRKQAVPIATQIDESLRAGPLLGRATERPATLREEQVEELKTLLAAVSRLEAIFGEAGDHKPYNAVPRPSLRVRHPT